MSAVWADDWPAERHDDGCLLWKSSDPGDSCSCGADDDERDPRNLFIPLPGSTAARLDALDVGPWPACSGDVA